MAYDLWYHQCCVHKLWSILCLPVAGACAETASSHGQTQHSTCTCKSSFTIYMVYDRWYHPCCVPGVGQYCACRCLMQKLYSAMGRHLYHLCCIRWVWSMLCLLLVWCPMAFNHQQTLYGNYILYAESYHVINVWSMFFICAAWVGYDLWSMLCLLMVWFQTALNHGQIQHGNLYLVPWALPCTRCMIYASICAVFISYDQCCVCFGRVPNGPRPLPDTAWQMCLRVELYYIHGV